MIDEKTSKMRTVVMQVMADSYLLTNGKKSYEEEFPGAKNVLGELSDEQALLLRMYLGQEFQRLGLDLKKEIEKNGEQMEVDVLSKYETTELAKRADQFILMTSILEQKKINAGAK